MTIDKSGTKPLIDAEWIRLLGFQGYGSIDAPFWFIGMEEGGDPPLSELRQRATLFDEREDLLAACNALGNRVEDIRTDTWRIMSHIVLWSKNDPNWDDHRRTLEYQKTHLGRRTGQTYLCDLMPIPCPGRGIWRHTQRYPSKRAYEKAVLPERLALLQKLLRQGRPRTVFCYGKGFWPYFEALFSNRTFTEEPDLKVKVSNDDDPTIILTWMFNRQYIPKSAVPALCSAAGLEQPRSDQEKVPTTSGWQD